MKKSCLATLLILFHIQVIGQRMSPVSQQVEVKTYPLLTALKTDKHLAEQLQANSVLNKILGYQIVRLSLSLNEKAPYDTVINFFKINNNELAIAGKELSRLCGQGSSLEKLVKEQLVRKGCYSLYENLSPSDLVAKAWELEAKSINHTISVYGQGLKPNYTGIDATNLVINDQTTQARIVQKLDSLLNKRMRNSMFFEISLSAALNLMDQSKRNNAEDYEPMEKTVNKTAVKAVQKTAWANYRYSLILVPGIGPDGSESISEESKAHCRLALQYYQKGLAPFIMTSGGRVHPNNTIYSEAEEMKSYFTDSLKVPESVIVMEPHARHTTTNLRNCGRLMYKYHFPVDKSALIVTDKDQSASISQMADRCIRELGNVPYRLGERVDEYALEFYPVRTALQVNGMEPLDP